MIATVPDLVALPGEPGVSIVILAGLAGRGEVFVYVADDGAVRTLWPVHGLPARLPERPLERGQPHLPNLVRAFLAALTPSQSAEVPHGL